jgi:hypothetical protein
MPATVAVPRAKPKRAYLAIQPCKASAPCGEPCHLNAAYAHVWHSCRDPKCGYCHAPQRFGRGTR